MALLDAYGRPVKLAELKEEKAQPSIMGVRTPVHESVANFLTPERLANVIASANDGDLTDFLTVAEEIEERYMHYRSVAMTRKLAVGKLPVRVEAADDSQEEIRDQIDTMMQSPQAKRLIFSMTDGIFKGYSASEIIWDTGATRENGQPMWWPKDFRWRDPRWFTVDRDTLSEIRLITEDEPSEGEALDPFKWVLHQPQLKMGLPIRGGLARLACIGYMVNNYTLRDWLSFAELFGIPMRLGRYEDSATPADQAKLKTAVAAMGSDGAGIIPKSMEVELVQAAATAGGDSLFEVLAEWNDKQISKLVLGQTMTTDDGSSLAQAKVHEGVRQDLIDADGLQIAETLNRDLIKPFVDLNWGVQKAYPTVFVESEDVEDLKALSEQLPTLVELGVPIEVSWARDKWAIPEPAKGAEILTTGAKPAEPAEDGDDEPPETDPDAEPPEDDDGDDVDAQAASRQSFAKAMTEAVLWGQKLKACNAEADQAHKDEIDQLVDESLADAMEFMDPMLQPIIDAANHATSYKELLSALDGLEGGLGKDDVTRSLAVAFYKAAGMGDATDKV